MKYLQLFESDEWYQDNIEDISNKFSKMSKLIIDYVFDNYERFKNRGNKTKNSHNVIEVWFENEPNYFNIRIEDASKVYATTHLSFTTYDFNQLLLYMNNPELSKNSKKFNV